MKPQSTSSVDTQSLLRPSAAQSSAAIIDPELAPSTISKKLLVSYSLGHVLNDLCAGCWFSYLLLYLQRGQDFSPTDAGTVMLCGQVVVS